VIRFKDTIRFDSIRFDSIRFDSIRFDSIRFDSIDSIDSFIHSFNPHSVESGLVDPTTDLFRDKASHA
jgi:hypothetical protein